MSKKAYINSIREEYSGLKDMPRESLASSVKTLADDLYAKDSHFIFELIQNAEDNNYPDDTDPYLSFEVHELVIDGKLKPTLIVTNNELGFNKNNVKAICQVGNSTKDKTQGYIGEKGIGFKSVFRITKCPYIFSNGFQFCLPEYDKQTKLGYIVPTWIDSPPKEIDSLLTTFLFPLDNSKYSLSKLINDLKDITPETILFLNRTRKLAISTTLHDKTDVTIEKKIISEFDTGSIVELTYTKKYFGKLTSEKYLYWVSSIEYEKPAKINNDKRQNIAKRVMSVAIPLDGKEHQGKLFAYLPVWEETGIPFLINADFLLVSSREGVREDEAWNLWLRDCIASTYTAAFLALLNNPDISLEQKLS